MPPRSPFRLLAPVALVVALLAVWLVVSPHTTGTGDPTPAARTTTRTERATEPRRRRYTVRAGDSFTSIARRFHVTVERLTELNPAADSQSLRRGQRLRLRD